MIVRVSRLGHSPDRTGLETRNDRGQSSGGTLYTDTIDNEGCFNPSERRVAVEYCSEVGYLVWHIGTPNMFQLIYRLLISSPGRGSVERVFSLIR